MSLPKPWVERIFAKLTLTYGRDFLSRWEGLDMEAVQADWAHELQAYAQNQDAIKKALQSLPEGKPPTVLEFRALCRGAPGDGPLKLSYAQADPAVVAAALSGLKRPDSNHPKAWAWALKDREERGDRLSIAQRDMWREALRTEAQRVTQ